MSAAYLIHFSTLYNGIFGDIDEIFGFRHGQFEIASVLLWYIGAIFGSILCGMNPNTWPAWKSNVR